MIRAIHEEQDGSCIAAEPPFPGPPDVAVYHGVVGEAVKLLEPHTEADPMAVLTQFLVGVGNLIGRTPYFAVEADRGKEPVRDRKDFPWFWGWDEQKQDFAGVGQEPDGSRWNDCHYTNGFKRGANQAR